MFTGFLGQFRPMARSPGEEEKEPARAEKPPESQKSSDFEDFLKTPEAKEFVKDWSEKTREGKPMYTKRGISSLLRELYPNYDTNKAVLRTADKILKLLGGMDGLTGFLAGWKAKSEGLMKGLKSILGGG